MILLGITGHPSSGKDTVADYLVKKYACTYISTSNLIREEIKKRNLGNPTRDLMYTVAQELRMSEGPDTLIRRAIAQTPDAKRLVMGGLRAVNEAKAVKDHKGFIVAVTAPLEIRFARAKARARLGDATTLTEFKAQEDREAVGSDPSASSVNSLISEADYTLENNGAEEILREQIDRLMQILEKKTL